MFSLPWIRVMTVFRNRWSLLNDVQLDLPDRFLWYRGEELVDDTDWKETAASAYQ